VVVRFRIVNVVATAVLDRNMELESLHEIFPHEVIHDQEIYGGRVAYFKSRSMEGKVSIFPSGKMISIGTKSPEQATKELELVAKTLNANLRTKTKIQSIVATASLRTSIYLEGFFSQIQEEKKFHAMYEPEQFPGLIIKFPVKKKSEATILLFSSGKLVCVGLTNLEEIHEAIETIKTRVTL